MPHAVALYRVSTAEQGRSGLGLDAQREAVARLCEGRGWEIIAEFTEVESGKALSRPKLAEALHRAKITGATLVIAKLDRLSRNIAFITTLQESGAKFVAADMPEANELTVHILAAVAQAERKAIGTRTREALAAAKARGQRLGNPNGAAPLRRAAKGNGAALGVIKAKADTWAQGLAGTVRSLRAEGVCSLPTMASALNELHVTTARGGRWHPSSVRNLLARLEALGVVV
jgi:DNA invertase Pin-like site-specific DNA recombinase